MVACAKELNWTLILLYMQKSTKNRLKTNVKAETIILLNINMRKSFLTLVLVIFFVWFGLIFHMTPKAQVSKTKIDKQD